MRSFFAHGVAAALVLTGAAACYRPPARCPEPQETGSPRTERCLPPRQRVVDLTQTFQSGMPVGPAGVPFQQTRVTGCDDGCRRQRLQLGDDTGTHLIAPARWVEGQRTVAQIPVEELVVPAVVIDVRAQVKGHPDYAVSANDILDWEAVHGPVVIGSLVLANTGWGQRFNDPARYANRDAQGALHFPGFGPDAAQLLVDRDVLGIGIDTLGTDPGAAPEPTTGRALAGANKIQLANLTHLDALPEAGATVIIGVLAVVDGTAAPARVLALVPEEAPDGEPGADDPTP